LTTLGLFSNPGLSGTIPDTLGNLSSLTYLGLYSNPGLSGTIPDTLVNLNSLTSLALFSNPGLSGTIPAALANCTKLQVFLAFETSLSGQIPTLPPQLSLVMLHNCRFSGQMPSLAHMTRLQNFSVFGNGIGGKLVLPPQASTMPLLLLQDNYLSCPISGAKGLLRPSLSNTINLLLPGNIFSGPVPSWTSMHAASFLYVDSLWEAWKVEILMAGGCFSLLLICVYVEMGRDHMVQFFVFKPCHHVVELELFSAKLVALGSLSATVLIPVYIVATKHVECGKLWLYSTIAYTDDEGMEWAVAVVACVFPACAVLGINALHAHSKRHVVGLAAEAPIYSHGQVFMMWFLWAGVIILASAPQALYIISTTLAPDENVVHLGRVSLEIVHHAAAFILFLIGAYILPGAAHRMLRMINRGIEDSAMAAKLIMVGRFITGIGVPFVCVIVFTNDCFGAWRSLWTQCTHNPERFEFTLPANMNTPAISVLSHADICSPEYKTGGRCPRAVIDILGTLIFRKLIDDAFLSPAFSMFKIMPGIQATVLYVCRLFKPDYATTKSIDCEVGGIIMLLEYPLLFGLYYPCLLPISAIALFLHGAVFHAATVKGTTLKYDTTPSTTYLWVSLLLGMGFTVWFYNEADLGGRWLVNTAMPVLTATSVYWTLHSKRQARKIETSVALKELRESLLPSDSEEVAESYQDGEAKEAAEVGLAIENESHLVVYCRGDPKREGTRVPLD